MEDIGEFGLVNDTLVNLQMNNSVRDGVASQYGFLSSTAIDSQGHQISVLSSANGTLAVNQTETHSYSIPLASGVVGVLADF